MPPARSPAAGRRVGRRSRPLSRNCWRSRGNRAASLRASAGTGHRVVPFQAAGIGDRAERRHCEGNDGADMLAAQMERFPAGDEDLRSGASGEQFGDRGRTVDQMLEVVEDEEKLAAVERPPSADSSVCSGPGSTPAMRAIAGSTSSGSRTAESGRNATPSLNSSARLAPISSASLVLPIPPGPVSVTNRTSRRPSNDSTSSSSVIRPTSVVGGTGSDRNGPERLVEDVSVVPDSGVVAAM